MLGLVGISAKDTYNVTILGATGAVGRAMIQTLERRHFPVARLLLLASGKSAGTVLQFSGRDIPVIDAEEADFSGTDIALFSAGADASRSYAGRMVSAGAVVIDNSSAYRMDESVPLVVPEVNPEAVFYNRGIISNPNCSTIQLVVALNPLKQLGIDSVYLSTYQAVSGMGQKGINGLLNAGIEDDIFPLPGKHRHYPMEYNVLPQCDAFTGNGYTLEEIKIVNESRKILSMPDLRISPTAVRVPVIRGHSESVLVRFRNEVKPEHVREILAASPGIIVADDIKNEVFPHPRMAESTGDVYIGRIRQDLSDSRAIWMFVVADNILKGAAWNAVQIAELLAGSRSDGKESIKIPEER
ncbi:Aspartate-semialdehyde dehydrogenase [Thermoplasmatales archaeon]|nr:Aspartate-semialdehyde dehydrogenase [Thermoplasmatales archaeon]